MTVDAEIVTVTSDAELAHAHAIRRQVFVDEQGISPELDFDADDVRSVHVLAYVGGTPIATGRLTRALYTPHLGVMARIAVLPPYRGRGLGERIVAALEGLAGERGITEIELHAHHYLEPFYMRLGYVVNGEDAVVSGHRLVTMLKRLA